MRLINWLWLESLLTDACEAEIRRFAAEHPRERFHAFCLEYDGLAATFGFSYGTRADLERPVDWPEERRPRTYRARELAPEGWRLRHDRIVDRAGHWERAARVLNIYREAMSSSDEDPDAAEFLWMRFEYLAECLVRQLLERRAFDSLRREEEFLAYAATDCETQEELEDRISRLYPDYRRATMEWAEHARPGSVRSRRCQGNPAHRQLNPDGLARCTSCNTWFCGVCAPGHQHPELDVRQSFFHPTAA